MDAITAFGLFAVTLTMLCYVGEERGPGWVLGFAGGCLLSSVYGFLLPGGWPFGAVELVWTFLALRRWRRASRAGAAGVP